MIRRPPTGVFVLCGIAVIVITAGVCASSLLRGAKYTASDQVSVTKAHPVASAHARLVYVRRLLNDPGLPADADSVLDFPIDIASIPRHVTLRPTANNVAVSATAGSPTRAADLVNAVAVAIYDAGWRRVKAHATLELARARQSLAGAHVASARRRVRKRVDRWKLLAATPVSDIEVGPRAAPPRPTRLVDRLFDRLPGPLPPRPSLGTALLAGLALSLLACALLYGAWLLSLRRRSATTPSTSSQNA